MKNGYLDGSSLPERIGLASEAVAFDDGEEEKPPSRIPIAISAAGRRRRRTWREMHEAPRGNGFGFFDRYFARRATRALLATEPSSDLEDDLIAAIDARRFSAADLLEAIDLDDTRESASPSGDISVTPSLADLFPPPSGAPQAPRLVAKIGFEGMQAEIRHDRLYLLMRFPSNFDDSDAAGVDDDREDVADRDDAHFLDLQFEDEEKMMRLYRVRPRERRIDPKMRPPPSCLTRQAAKSDGRQARPRGKHRKVRDLPARATSVSRAA